MYVVDKNLRFWFYSRVLDLYDLQKQENSASLQALSAFSLFLFSVSPFVFPVLKLHCVADAGFLSFYSTAAPDLPCWPVRSGDSVRRMGKTNWKYDFLKCCQLVKSDW